MATDRLNALATELRSACGLEIEVITADVVDHVQIEPVLKRLRAEPQIDILGNNAGAGLLVASVQPMQRRWKRLAGLICGFERDTYLAVNEAMYVRQAFSSQSEPMYSLALQKVLPSGSSTVEL